MAQAGTKRIRTCVGCGAQSDKVGLLRIVRAADGSVRFDATGRVPGRGAYVCSAKCLEGAFSARKLQRALRCGIERSDMDRIAADLATSSAAAR